MDIKEIFLHNIYYAILEKEKCLPIEIKSRTSTLGINFKFCENNLLDDVTMKKIVKCNPIDTNMIFEIVDILYELYSSNVCEDYIITFKINDIYWFRDKREYSWHFILKKYTLFNDYELKFKCKECGGLQDIKRYNAFKNNNYKDKFCCQIKFDELYAKSHEITKNFETFKKYFETETINAGLFKLKSIYTIQCRNRHIVRANTTNSVNFIQAHFKMRCWICDDGIEDKYEFFKILKQELKANYYIEEHLHASKIKTTKDLKRLSKCVVYTYNNKKHLTGKIVFDDPIGEEQAKANSNKLVFRWFDINYINDRNYCVNFFNKFYRDIISKNKLRTKTQG